MLQTNNKNFTTGLKRNDFTIKVYNNTKNPDNH